MGIYEGEPVGRECEGAFEGKLEGALVGRLVGMELDGVEEG